MSDFRMSWHDFVNLQFVYNGGIFNLRKLSKVGRKPLIRHKILFMLNAHRGQFVSQNDLIEFIYDDQDPDDWPDFQENVLSVIICRLRKELPVGVSIKAAYNFGYRLDVV